MKPIRPGSTVIVIQVHSNMVIYMVTDGYQIRQVGVTRQRNRRKRVSNGSLVLGKPNRKQNKVWNNTYTQSRDVGIYNIRYDVVRLVLV
jgi:hypothetical protein